MSTHSVFRGLFFVALLGVSFRGLAGDPAPPPATFDPATFEQERADLAYEVESGTRYGDLTPRERQSALDSLARIAKLMDGVTSLDKMSRPNKVKLFNLQEKVNTILTKADPDNTLECRQEKVVGSHKPHHVCQTLAERKRNSENSRDFMRGATQPKTTGNSGG